MKVKMLVPTWRQKTFDTEALSAPFVSAMQSAYRLGQFAEIADDPSASQFARTWAKGMIEKVARSIATIDDSQAMKIGLLLRSIAKVQGILRGEGADTATTVALQDFATSFALDAEKVRRAPLQQAIVDWLRDKPGARVSKYELVSRAIKNTSFPQNARSVEQAWMKLKRRRREAVANRIP